MIEENFVRLYASDFVRMAKRPGLMAADDPALERRIVEARKHAGVMDARKGEGHLAALISRLKDEAGRLPSTIHNVLADDIGAIASRHRFLAEVASRLGAVEQTLPDRSSRIASFV
ncbi:hypothetical protein [Brevundimonas goettingensis]|uniref:Uncharacterized protein n=1 Tax=Brevundimonas goettingensis TaxID=2774190 RepID=A0A975C4C7_9CAUL|nr:hypothetical protein [Brevundimonas goettingensis]QTC92239.1 hypothetical protein IFJ75_04890 [Brevundimonas goettingensis]